MYSTIKEIHSGWAYLVLIILIIAFVNALIGFSSRKKFTPKDFKLSLFTLVFSHIQLLIGIVMYFLSPYFYATKQVGMGGIMKDATIRLYVVEHPLTMIIGITLITIGWSKHKKIVTDNSKFKTISIFYGLALLLFLSRIPWQVWF